VKTGGKKMENQPEASNMVMMFDRMLQEQRSMSEIAEVAAWLVRRNGQFNGKDVSWYLQDYKAEMLRCKISKGQQVVAAKTQESARERERATKRSYHY
jgi:hypothetical protein